MARNTPMHWTTIFYVSIVEIPWAVNWHRCEQTPTDALLAIEYWRVKASISPKHSYKGKRSRGRDVIPQNWTWVSYVLGELFIWRESLPPTPPYLFIKYRIDRYSFFFISSFKKNSTQHPLAGRLNSVPVRSACAVQPTCMCADSINSSDSSDVQCICR